MMRTLERNERWKQFKGREGLRLTLKEVNAMLGTGFPLSRERDRDNDGQCYDEQYGWSIDGVPVVLDFFSSTAISNPDSAILRSSRIVYGQ
jgi:hypothetical protein